MLCAPLVDLQKLLREYNLDIHCIMSTRGKLDFHCRYAEQSQEELEPLLESTIAQILFEGTD